MRILVLLPSQPFPAYNGQTHRLALVTRSLAERHQVSLACFVEPLQSQEMSDADRARFFDVRLVKRTAGSGSFGGSVMRRLSAEPADVHEFRSEEMARHLAELVAASEPELVLLGDPALVGCVEFLGRKPLAIDYVCESMLQFERMGALAGPIERQLWTLRRAKYARFLRRIEPLVDVAFLNSAEDLVSLAMVWPRSKLMHVANGLNLDDYPVGLATPVPDRLLYPGSVAYPPNRDAVAWFGTEVMPLVRNAHPDAELRVTGMKPDDGSAPEFPGIVYTGRVQDVRVEIASAWATVVPLRLGAGGARFKVIESMALGTPVIGTAIGVEGLELADGQDYLAAEAPADLAAACVRLLTDGDLRHRVGVAGRRRMEMDYSWGKLSRRIEHRLMDLLHGPAAVAV
ncbi:hypothetical protein IP69_18340 [Bosea sp. AAP35]|uniref:glycosyltransferase n=1 Tax=Bosea sp. AAP35 TaxID=1523417 RepID=UPI0006B97865|nr:glycosyltransferase [Bosea sp. AAP35]KPF64338.1 hypothetical protein IP69_18340 [Bosea sp. AAP35]